MVQEKGPESGRLNSRDADGDANVKNTKKIIILIQKWFLRNII